jgi:CRP/FNR family transcriptional regulator, dissimilatory nitrate respiration regulator
LSREGIALQNIPMLSAFSAEELHALFGGVSYPTVSYPKGSLIYIEGQECKSWDILLSGNIVVQRIDANGNSMTVGRFKTGDSIGGNLLFSKNPIYPMAVIAKAETTILQIGKDLVMEMCQYNRQFLGQFLSCVSERSIFLTERIKSIAMRTIRESINEYLVLEFGKQKSHIIELPISKKELAEQMGVSRTSLSREMQKMKNEGIIDYQGKKVKLTSKILELCDCDET